MSSPKFHVGEEVILCSVSLPQYNGEQVVAAVFVEGETVWTDTSVTPYTKWVADKICYHLEGEFISVKTGVATLWDECALRKKQKPSEDSFDELMEKLMTEGETA